MIEDFIIENPLFGVPGGRHLDYEKIVGLPEKEFAELYLEFMTEYKDKNGWWSKEKMPYCSVCNSAIPGPERLRRYYGRTLDPECFSKVYQKDRKDQKGIMQQYWDRVAKLVLDS